MQQAPARAGNGGNLVGLIKSLTERSETKQIFIRRPDLSVRLGRSAAVSLPPAGGLCVRPEPSEPRTATRLTDPVGSWYAHLCSPWRDPFEGGSAMWKYS